MSRMTLALSVLALLLVAMLCSLAASYSILPPKVASHFNAAGQPDGWMSRSSHLVLMGMVGLGLPLVMAGVFWGVRFLPAQVINLPHRQYWLAAERREQTSSMLLELGLWFVVMQTLFFLVIHWLVVAANRQAQVQLSAAVWPLLLMYLALVGVWLWCFWQRFRLPV